MLSQTIQDAQKMLNAFKLKFTYRFTDRAVYEQERESVASHTWWMMVIADYLLEKLEQAAPWKYQLNREKIYSLIVYHDPIEAETWDEDNDPSNVVRHSQKHIAEAEAMKTFPAKLPKEIQTRFQKMFQEYKERVTSESRFVKIVDIIDSEFLVHGKKEFYTNWTEEVFSEKRLPHFQYFPELRYIQEDLLQFYRDNNYF